MANMSHCRFENTYKDLYDCFEALNSSSVQDIVDEANEYERPFVKGLIALCAEITEYYGHEVGAVLDEEE